MNKFSSINIDLPLIHQGKVRDIYSLDHDHLLMITSDRISAFDVVFDDPIIDKGKVLTEVSNFWFEKTQPIVANHLSDLSLDNYLPNDQITAIADRYVIAKKLKPIAIEAIVRGYLIGSGWKDYQKDSSVCGIRLPENLQLAQKLPEPIFTPSTKAAVGDHDVNVSLKEAEEIVGKDLANQVADISLQVYKYAADYALERGIIIADTKFEFGLDENNNVVLMDEVLTPDSSRFWSLKDYQVGTSPTSFDKQIIRDYLETLDWNKQPPGPKLPEEIVQKTANKYKEIKAILCE
ncbi:MAG: phosphoribosylaminoimidazolesuccinocarboxamide synthase [Gammaproteobacteria bacterium]|nr:phosphoribosylaminoimidazolesuccinocarboxamide synthase [Gammaproteobacteria bacterium]